MGGSLGLRGAVNRGGADCNEPKNRIGRQITNNAAMADAQQRSFFPKPDCDVRSGREAVKDSVNDREWVVRRL